MRLCIFGAGGFAKEVWHLAKNCGYDIETMIDKGSENLFDPKKHLAVIAIANPTIRQQIAETLSDAQFACLMKAKILDRWSVKLGRGAIVCDGSILTCDITIGDFAQLNLITTIGHDCVIGDYFTASPGVHISGKCKIGNRVYFGTNSCVIEGISICDDVIIGAGAVVVKDIAKPGTYIGVPAMEKHG